MVSSYTRKNAGKNEDEKMNYLVDGLKIIDDKFFTRKII